MDDTSPRNANEPFGVSHILVTELPTTIGTPDEPPRYDVAAVFTRRPAERELALLATPEVETRLAQAGYTGVRLHASDRRLIIEQTNLAELADGLAALIGDILLDLGNRAAAEQLSRDTSAADRERTEHDRAGAVLEAAKRIDFRPQHSMYQ